MRAEAVSASQDYESPAGNMSLMERIANPNNLTRAFQRVKRNVKRNKGAAGIDRMVQQAIQQILQGEWEPGFSTFSYGFRPNRSAHQAINQTQSYICEGYDWVVDIDLSKFFDRVNHDRLMAKLAVHTEDKRVLRLIRRFLQSGIMENGLVKPQTEGVPQGGPLSLDHFSHLYYPISYWMNSTKSWKSEACGLFVTPMTVGCSYEVGGRVRG